MKTIIVGATTTNGAVEAFGCVMAIESENGVRIKVMSSTVVGDSPEFYLMLYSLPENKTSAHIALPK